MGSGLIVVGVAGAARAVVGLDAGDVIGVQRQVLHVVKIGLHDSPADIRVSQAEGVTHLMHCHIFEVDAIGIAGCKRLVFVEVQVPDSGIECMRQMATWERTHAMNE